MIWFCLEVVNKRYKDAFRDRQLSRWAMLLSAIYYSALLGEKKKYFQAYTLVSHFQRLNAQSCINRHTSTQAQEGNGVQGWVVKTSALKEKAPPPRAEWYNWLQKGRKHKSLNPPNKYNRQTSQPLSLPLLRSLHQTAWRKDDSPAS